MRLIWWHTSAPTYQMNYVNMRPNSVDMQHDQDMRDIYVYLQHNNMYVNICKFLTLIYDLYYVACEHNYVAFDIIYPLSCI